MRLLQLCNTQQDHWPKHFPASCPVLLCHSQHVPDVLPSCWQETKGPNSKLVESLADAGVRLNARADSGAAAAPAAADAAPAVKPAELPAGAPSINERLEQQAASAGSAGRADSFDYLEIINADPVSREQLAVPLNRVTRYTSQVGAACPCSA